MQQLLTQPLEHISILEDLQGWLQDLFARLVVGDSYVLVIDAC